MEESACVPPRPRTTKLFRIISSFQSRSRGWKQCSITNRDTLSSMSATKFSRKTSSNCTDQQQYSTNDCTGQVEDRMDTGMRFAPCSPLSPWTNIDNNARSVTTRWTEKACRCTVSKLGSDPTSPCDRFCNMNKRYQRRFVLTQAFDYMYTDALHRLTGGQFRSKTFFGVSAHSTGLQCQSLDVSSSQNLLLQPLMVPCCLTSLIRSTIKLP